MRVCARVWDGDGRCGFALKSASCVSFDLVRQLSRLSSDSEGGREGRREQKQASGLTQDVSDVNMPNHRPISPPVRISVTATHGTAGNLIKPRLEINSNYYVKVNFITV